MAALPVPTHQLKISPVTLAHSDITVLDYLVSQLFVPAGNTLWVVNIPALPALLTTMQRKVMPTAPLCHQASGSTMLMMASLSVSTRPTLTGVIPLAPHAGTAGSALKRPSSTLVNCHALAAPTVSPVSRPCALLVTSVLKKEVPLRMMPVHNAPQVTTVSLALRTTFRLLAHSVLTVPMVFTQFAPKVLLVILSTVFH